MACNPWKSLDDMIAVLTAENVVADEFRAQFDAVLKQAATAAQAIHTIAACDRETMLEGAEKASRLIAILEVRFGADRDSPSFMAGRLEALSDVLGFGAEQCAPAGFADVVLSEKYKPVLVVLKDGAKTLVELAETLGQQPEVVRGLLDELQYQGVTLSHMRIRTRYHQLSPAAQSLLDA
jgi:hypothetical protein